MEEEYRIDENKLLNSNYLKVWWANFALFFAFYIIMPLLPLYMRATFPGVDKHTIGLVLSGYTITALLIRPFGGYFADTFDRKTVLLVCFGLFAIFFGGYFITSSLALFAVIRTLHGAPFGATTVANSTMMVDVLPSKRRTEGIGYYGLANNLAMAIGPSVGMYLYNSTGSFSLLFSLSLIVAFGGFAVNYTLKVPHSDRHMVKNKEPLSTDRFFLLNGWPESICMACLSFGFGVISTYLAIYTKDMFADNPRISTGTWFALIAVGLMASRIVGGRSLRKGKVLENASFGMSLSVFGYLLFVALPNEIGYYGSALIVGLGNGHMFPGMQNMFINLAPNNRRGTANSTLLISWDVGIGLGVILGGSFAEQWGYSSAFWLAFIVNAIGVAWFWSYSRAHYIKHKLN